MLKRIILLFLLFLISLPSFAASEEDLFSEEDLTLAKESWNIGLSTLAAGSLDKRYEYLRNSIPLLLSDEISTLKSHRLSDNELHYYRKNHIDSKIISLEKEKSSLHYKRDSLLFSDLSGHDRRVSYREISDQIEEKEHAIESWRGLKPEDITLEKELPIIFQEYGASQKLTDPGGQISRFMENSDFDLLLTGRVEQLDDMIYLEVSGWLQSSEEPVLSVSDTVREEDIDTIITDWSTELRTLILGRTWSGIRIHAEPAGAVLSIDGESRGVGSLEIDDLEPGYVTVSAMAAGYKSQSSQVYLLPGETLELDLTLEEGMKNVFYLTSDPPGADVYFGASWLGQTPLYTDFPSMKGQFRVVKDDFMPFYLPSDEIQGESLTVQLGNNLFDRQAELELAKKKFYRSLGWFSISLAVPVILMGVYQNLDYRYYSYANDYISTGDQNSFDRAEEYKHKSDIAYYGFWGGVSISGGLLINTLFKLRDYIRAAEKSTEE